MIQIDLSLCFSVKLVCENLTEQQREAWQSSVYHNKGGFKEICILLQILQSTVTIWFAGPMGKMTRRPSI